MISIIAAAAKNGVIGSGGDIPWDIPADRAYFRKITTGGVVIMGRRTYESIGFPLPDRYNIVVSRSKHFSGKMLRSAESLEKAIMLARAYAEKHRGISGIFLCGGERIYAEGLKYAQRIYLTELDDRFDGDRFLPEFSSDEFTLTSRTRDEGSRLYFSVYDRVTTCAPYEQVPKLIMGTIKYPF